MTYNRKNTQVMGRIKYIKRLNKKKSNMKPFTPRFIKKVYMIKKFL